MDGAAGSHWAPWAEAPPSRGPGGGQLYVGGAFSNRVAWRHGCFAKWAAAARPRRAGPIAVFAIASDTAGHLFAGGTFSFAGTTLSPYIAQANLFYLEGLEPTAGTLSPAFADTTLAYTASVPNGVSSIILFPTAAQGDATLTVNGFAVTSGAASQPIALAVGGQASPGLRSRWRQHPHLTIGVSAPHRPPPMRISPACRERGTLAPTSSADFVCRDRSVQRRQLTCTPTDAESNATIQVNGLTVASGAHRARSRSAWDRAASPPS